MMLGFGVLVLIVVVVVVVVVRLLPRKKKPGSFTIRDIGSVIDRSIMAYRRHLVPALVLSAVCFVLGSANPYSWGSFFTWLLLSDPSNLSMETLPGQYGILSLLMALGIGRTVLACGIAEGMRAEENGEPVTLRSFFPLQRPMRVVLLALVMIAPSLLLSYLSWLGGLVALLWTFTPAVMVYEQISPWAAMKRSVGLVRKNFSITLNSIVLLWIIAWIVVGGVLFGSISLLGWLNLLDRTLLPISMLIAWGVAEILVAPIIAFGAVICYRFVVQRAAQQEAAVSTTLVM